MFVKGKSFSGCQTDNTSTNRRIYAHATNKKLLYEFQKWKNPQLNSEELQLEQQLKVLDKFFEKRRKHVSNLIKMSHNEMVKDTPRTTHTDTRQQNKTHEEENILGTPDSTGPIFTLSDLAPRRCQTPPNKNILYMKKTLPMSCRGHKRESSEQSSTYYKKSVNRHMLRHISLMNSMLEPCRIAKMQLQSRIDGQNGQAVVMSVNNRRRCVTPSPRLLMGGKSKSPCRKEVKLGAWESFHQEESDMI